MFQLIALFQEEAWQDEPARQIEYSATYGTLAEAVNAWMHTSYHWKWIVAEGIRLAVKMNENGSLTFLPL